jgi:hypothetical protein
MRGGQHQVMLLLQLLNEAGHEVVLLARRGAPLYETARTKCFDVRPTAFWSVYAESSRADLLHVHDARSHTLAAVAARRPFVVSRRVAFPVKRGLLSAWKYRTAARYLAVSRFVSHQLTVAGIDPANIDVVYDAVPDLTPGEWDPNAPAVALHSSDPGKCSHLIEQAAALAGIPIIFSDDLLRDLERASMFVYLSRSEGLGSAALLSMAKGIPVIASQVGGLAEVFEDSISGLYTSGDPKETAALMRKIIEVPGLGEQLLLGGRRRVQENFSAPVLLERTLAAYRRALQ